MHGHCVAYGTERVKTSWTELFLFRTKSNEKALKGTSKPPIIEPVSAYEDDLKMRAAMYGVLFQAFADQVIDHVLTCDKLCKKVLCTIFVLFIL